MTRLEQLLDELSRAPDSKQITTLAEEAIGYVRREDDPILWANLNGAIASSLVNSVRGKYTPELLEKVLAAYERALTVYTAEQTPAIWAQTQRNLGATHFGAVQCRLGDEREHLEAAIQAYQRALEISPDKHNPGIWLRAQNELANALVLAATWRGPSAFIESGRAFAAVLTTVSREASPGDWAMLNLQLAGSLSESGASEYTEDAIRAAENALLEIRRETLPVNWGEANLLLGGLYRARREGIRGDNLERSVHSLDNALSVFTASSNPQKWYRAHYHRGPAYLFRQQGDHAENLRRSLESLRIAIDATPKEQEPAAWGSLQECAGQALVKSRDIEAAIEAFESALAVLPPDPRSLSWKQANRNLGQVYLDRQKGDRGENVELAIQRLTTVQESLPTPDDPKAWSATYADLSEGYLRRTVGSRESNRAKAIEYAETALTVPPEQWYSILAWRAAQYRLVLLYLTEKEEATEKPRAAAVAAAPQRTPYSPDDPFDMAADASQAVEALKKGILEELDPGWHVPSMLNEEASLLRRKFEQFLSSGVPEARTPEQRSDFEPRRWHLFRAILEHVAEKRVATRRTQHLFHDVELGEQPFVLFLRGFGTRPQYYSGVTVVAGGGQQFEEKIEKKRLVEKLEPIPLVWISNPVDSGPMDIVTAGTERMDAKALGYRVETGGEWEKCVRALIGAAAFIIFHNPVTSPGLSTEIGLVGELGRMEDAFFYVPEEGRRKLNDEAIAHVRSAAKGRPLEPGTLPQPTCRWIEGHRREVLETQFRAVQRWTERLAQSRSQVLVDQEIDAYFYLLATLVLLEEIDKLPQVLLALADTFRAISEKELPEQALLAQACVNFANEIASIEDIGKAAH